MTLLSVVIPARNEKYLNRTVRDLLDKAVEEIEIIVVLDGYWENEVVNDKRVHYLHFGQAKGMRNAINCGVALSRGKYILKTDAHCLYNKGFDKQLKTDHTKNTILVPSRYPLNPDTWEVIKRKDDKYPVEYEYIDSNDLHGVEWRERRDERKNHKIDDIISAQGSCWFTTKRWFGKIGGLDESYGTFFLEFQELSFKTWTQGGKVKVDKNTWYAHWHKTEGRGYALSDDRDGTVKKMQTWRDNHKWREIVERFQPMPTWDSLFIPEDIHLGKGLLELELPWFAPDAIRWLDKHLTKDMTVLEFGAGGSTPFFARRCKQVTSLETSKEWLIKVSEYIKNKNIENAKLYDPSTSTTLGEYDVVLIDSPIRSNMVSREVHLWRVIGMKPRIIIVDDFARLDIPDNIEGYETKKFLDSRWKGQGVQMYVLSK